MIISLLAAVILPIEKHIIRVKREQYMAYFYNYIS